MDGYLLGGEGIETGAQLDWLRGLKCDRGQGYFLARPMPGEQILDWSRQDRSHLCSAQTET